MNSGPCWLPSPGHIGLHHKGLDSDRGEERGLGILKKTNSSGQEDWMSPEPLTLELDRPGLHTWLGYLELDYCLLCKSWPSVSTSLTSLLPPIKWV